MTTSSKPVDWEEVYQVLRRRLHSSPDSDDLLHAFLVDRMPQVSSVVIRLPESERIPYIQTSFRNYCRDQQRRLRYQRRALELFAAEAKPDARLVPRIELSTLTTSLPPLLRRAVRGFFGADSSPQSIRELARKLGISRRAAESAIVDGILLLADQLGTAGALDPTDLQIVSALINGQTEHDIARTLGLRITEVRAAVRRAREQVRNSLF